jgi:hypothetical protein
MSHWDFGRPTADDDYAPQPGDDEDWGGEWGDDLGPYPLTYERDQGGPAPAGAAPAPGGSGPGPYEASPAQSGGGPAQYEAGGVRPATDAAAAAGDPARRGLPPRLPWEREPAGRARFTPRGGPWRTAGPAAPEPGPEDWPDWYAGERPGGDQGGRGSRGGRRWLIPAGLAVAAAAVGAGAALLTAGHPGAPSGQGARSSQPASGPRAGAGTQAAQGSVSSAAPSPGSPGSPASAAGGSAAASPGAGGGTAGGTAAAPLTMAQAEAVLASYTSTNNAANAQRSDTQLAAIETGSSYALDAALYQAGRAAGTATFPPFEPVSAAYYLPRDEPQAGPRWFVVQVSNALTASPAKVMSTEYVLFTQPVPGGPWLNTIEPYLVPGASAPRITLGADGLATAVSPDTADAVAPGQLPAATAASLDGAGGQNPVADPGNLADAGDARLWRKDVPDVTVKDTHAPAAGAGGQEFALLASDGGALVFYTDAASLTVTPPAGSVLHVTIPGFYSPSQALTTAGITYLEQFAAYDPPAGGGAPRIVADYSAVTGKD